MPSNKALFKFYVYEILDEYGGVIYVGKGSNGRMFRSLSERSGHSCREVARFNDEFAAYDYEVERIAQYDELLNMNCGGYGGVSRSRKIPYVYRPNWITTRQALDGVAKCIKLKEAGFIVKIAGFDTYEYALQSMSRWIGEFGKDKVFEYMKRHNINGARYV